MQNRVELPTGTQEMMLPDGSPSGVMRSYVSPELAERLIQYMSEEDFPLKPLTDTTEGAYLFIEHPDEDMDPDSNPWVGLRPDYTYRTGAMVLEYPRGVEPLIKDHIEPHDRKVAVTMRTMK